MHKLIHITLALLVLLGAVGLQVSRHFCMGELKSVALFGEAEKCHQEQKKPHCPFHPVPEKEAADSKKKGCCDDELELVQIDDQEQTVTETLPAVTAVLPDYPPRLFSYQPPHLRPRKNTNFENYRPPPLIPDVARKFQVVRI